MSETFYEPVTVYQVLHRRTCYLCKGDGLYRPVIDRRREQTASYMTASLTVKHGDPVSDKPCTQCGGKGHTYTPEFYQHHSLDSLLEDYPNARLLEGGEG